MKKYLLRVACAAALSVLTAGSYVQAQSVFSPKVNALRSHHQNRRAAAADSAAQRVVVVVTCSADASMAAIANQMTEQQAIVRVVMGNQIMVETTIDKLDQMAAIDGVLLIDIPKDGRQRTDTARKASQVDEVHAGKATGLPDLPQAYTGKGIIIGLIDGGFDFTHPMFKDKDGNLRIKGVYIAADETNREKGENIDELPVTDPKGEAINNYIMGEFFTNKDVILDTLICKNATGSHGTHCASIAAGTIMDYKDQFTGKRSTSGKLGGMAPDADIYMAVGASTDAQKKKYPDLKNNITTINCMQALYAMKHFAEKEGKPLIVSWSENTHDGFHDGTSTMARYIRNYCKAGNVMALCSSNEGDDSMFVDRTISKGKTLKYAVKRSFNDFNADAFIRTNKEIKVNLVIVDTTFKPVYTCNLPLTSYAKEGNVYETEFEVKVDLDLDEQTNKYSKTVKVNNKYYDDDGKKVADYINSGTLGVGVYTGKGLDKNDQQFDYVEVYLSGSNLDIPVDKDKKDMYIPMLLITSADEDVRIQGWGDYCSIYANTMDDENTIKPGSSVNSMGDWNTSGEPVSIGAYATDLRELNPYYPKYSTEQFRDRGGEKLGRYASFSSYGRDFSDTPHDYPDVSAPGVAIYAAGNSFKPEEVYQTAEYTDQFKGQTKPRKYPYSIMSGTSMSTPAAAGVIALWMQAAKESKTGRFPGKTLTNEDVKDIIKHSSVTDEFTKAFPLRYGAGKINAYKGLLYVLDLETAISELPTKHIGAKLDGRTLTINGNPDVQVSIYNLSGQKVFDAQAVSGTVVLPQLPAGVYAVKIGNQGSTLIRL